MNAKVAKKCEELLLVCEEQTQWNNRNSYGKIFQKPKGQSTEQLEYKVLVLQTFIQKFYLYDLQ